jgi:hypothetical protein
MEVLAGASSTFAVLSLAIQLAENIKKLHCFWSSVQDAPLEIRGILKDLDIVSEILDEILVDSEDRDKPFDRSLIVSLRALERCAESLQTLKGVVDALNNGLGDGRWKTRKWAALKMVWKEDKIVKFLEVLRDVKITLLLARQNSSRYYHSPGVEMPNMNVEVPPRRP